MKRTTRDVPGVIVGTMLTGGATVWMLTEYGALRSDDLGLTGALVLVAAGIVGLGASRGD